MDRVDFAETYPFIPYQFRLLQNVFTDIRKHGFAGKHLSSGERSLIGAFQGTAKTYSNGEIGTLIPFYAFYDTIEEFLELSKTDEYKQKYSSMEKVYLGDYVEAIVPHLNLKESMKVVATKYDVLAQKYVEFELSNSNKKEKNFINKTL